MSTKPPSALAAALAELDLRRAEILALEPLFSAAERVAERFADLQPGIREGVGYVWIDLHLPSLAAAQPLLAALVRDERLHPDGRNDYTDEAIPRVTYEYLDGSPRRPLIVSIHLVSATQCRLEKTGEKIVPIYKIVCDGAQEP